MRKKVLVIFGTRPEAIKMAPVVGALKKCTKFRTLVCVTAQHRQMLDQVLSIFKIVPDFDLDVMKPDQDLSDLTSDILTGIHTVIEETHPDLTLVHGDTTTSFAASLASFYGQIPVGHVEAGLRTQNIYSPWPEEMNRRITGRLATWHFAPTQRARANLLKENIDDKNIVVTGNTVIDALFSIDSRINSSAILRKNLEKIIHETGYDMTRLKERRLVLITGHRRENFGDGFVNICEAIKELSSINKTVDFLYPVHLNPNVRKVVFKILDDNRNENVFLTGPMDYLPFIYLMKKSSLVLTDSGGIQEEAPSFGKPVLVMRDTTERPEGVEAGIVELVGTDPAMITRTVNSYLAHPERIRQASQIKNPYGDGNAAARITDFIIERL